MDIVAARSWLILASLVVTGLHFVFFLTAPAFGYPLNFEQGIRLLEIVLPVFLGYLGLATHYVFGKSRSTGLVRLRGTGHLLALLVRGPIIVFGLAMLSAIIAFGYSNRESAPIGSGMSMNALAASISTALGLLSVSTSVLVSYVFSTQRRD